MLRAKNIADRHIVAVSEYFLGPPGVLVSHSEPATNRGLCDLQMCRLCPAWGGGHRNLVRNASRRSRYPSASPYATNDL